MVMAAIFVNFRNGDGDWAAKLIRDRLARHFGTEAVFLSSDSIQLSDRFPDVMLDKARTCDVLLALVGPSWLTITDDDGQARLFADDDWVRREIAAALAAGRPVAVILLNYTPLPAPEDLPEDIRELAYRQGHRVSRRQFDTDMNGLENALMSAIPGLTPTEEPESGRPGVRLVTDIEEAYGSDIIAYQGMDPPKSFDSRISVGRLTNSRAKHFERNEPRETEPPGKEGTG
jgi:TIR domain